ncbi:MAG TPA: ABC transporter permease [Thermoanaerobaculia bacterium]|nr:ABC transporter permease [Thermoanaerobaculia bacterium]
MINWLSQIAAVTWLNLRTIGQRRGASTAAAFGILVVVAVFIAILSIAVGFRQTMTSTGDPATVIVLRGGSDSEMTSGIARDSARIISEAPGLLRSPAGPLASAELFVIVDVPKRTTKTDANVPLRGVQPAAFAVRRNFRLLEGRRFETGKNEVIVGQGAAKEFAGLEVGHQLRWGENTWKVVGIFSDGGSLSESEIWCDVDVLQPAYRRTGFQSVHARLESAAAYDRFKDALTADPRLDILVQRETDYYAGQSEALTALVYALGILICPLMVAGAVFGALNTMFSSVSTRSREIATLRALGFGSGPVVISVMVESLFLAAVGGGVGAAFAYYVFNGFRAATINWQSFSQVSFAFRVTPALLAMGTSIALAIGLVGGLLPAIRAARLPVATALREL